MELTQGKNREAQLLGLTAKPGHGRHGSGGGG